MRISACFPSSWVGNKSSLFQKVRGSVPGETDGDVGRAHDELSGPPGGSGAAKAPCCQGGPDADSSAAHLLPKSDSEGTPADSGSEEGAPSPAPQRCEWCRPSRGSDAAP